MAVVRREGDWRLEKREEGLYEITYQNSAQRKVVTPTYDPGMLDGPIAGVVPVEEVNSYTEAEGIFEELAHGEPPLSVGSLDTEPPTSFTPDIDSADVGLDFEMPDIELGSNESSSDMGFGNGGGSDFADFDLPPGGIAIVFLLAGGLVIRETGFGSGSIVFWAGIGFLAVAALILTKAVVLAEEQGLTEAVSYLIEGWSESTGKSETSDGERTPPLSQKRKNTLIFDRAGQECEWCGEHFDQPHVHHIEPRREGGPNVPSNLIVLCPNCHSRADREAIPRSKLRAKVKRQPEVSFE